MLTGKELLIIAVVSLALCLPLLQFRAAPALPAVSHPHGQTFH